MPGGPESQPRLNPFDSRIVRSVALQHPVHQPSGAATSVGGGGLAALRRSPTHSAAAHLKGLALSPGAMQPSVFLSDKAKMPRHRERCHTVRLHHCPDRPLCSGRSCLPGAQHRNRHHHL